MKNHTGNIYTLGEGILNFYIRYYNMDVKAARYLQTNFLRRASAQYDLWKLSSYGHTLYI